MFSSGVDLVLVSVTFGRTQFTPECGPSRFSFAGFYMNLFLPLKNNFYGLNAFQLDVISHCGPELFIVYLMKDMKQLDMRS